jgi:hypothetical protein
MSREVTSMPGVQKPHCRAWRAENASRSAAIVGSPSKPSIVVIRDPSQSNA